MDKTSDLKRFATEIRIEQLKAFKELGFGHLGGCLSITDCVAALYGKLMKYDPKNPKWAERDYLVCSKGHAGPAIYSALALKGFFPTDWLSTLNKPNTKLPSHCDGNLTPGVDATTGSLGQGASIAGGIALAHKNDLKSNKVFLILGDGECNEGQVWEMAMFAAHKKLSNLIVFIDKNGKQLDGTTDQILDLGNLTEKFTAFGWHCLEINGNDPDTIVNAVELAVENNQNKPIAVILNTVKGFGVKFIEDMEFNHHIVLSKEQADQALSLLEGELADV